VVFSFPHDRGYDEAQSREFLEEGLRQFDLTFSTQEFCEDYIKEGAKEYQVRGKFILCAGVKRQ
jgi:hypothetical protein